MNESVILWNKATKLKRPTAGTIKSELDVDAPAIVSVNTPNWLYLGNNLVMKLAPGRTLSAEESVLSIHLILIDEFFSPKANVQTQKLPAVEVFGLITPFCGQALLDQLNADDERGWTLATEPDRWTLYYGDALVFTFLPRNRREAVDPAESELASMEFYYQLSYTGRRVPDILMVD